MLEGPVTPLARVKNLQAERNTHAKSSTTLDSEGHFVDADCGNQRHFAQETSGHHPAWTVPLPWTVSSKILPAKSHHPARRGYLRVQIRSQYRTEHTDLARPLHSNLWKRRTLDDFLGSFYHGLVARKTKAQPCHMQSLSLLPVPPHSSTLPWNSSPGQEEHVSKGALAIQLTTSDACGTLPSGRRGPVCDPCFLCFWKWPAAGHQNQKGNRAAVAFGHSGGQGMTCPYLQNPLSYTENQTVPTFMNGCTCKQGYRML